MPISRTKRAFYHLNKHFLTFHSHVLEILFGVHRQELLVDEKIVVKR